MDEWRVFSQRFLTAACREYFATDFNSLTPVDLVTDPRLRRLLIRSADDLAQENWERSLCACKLAFEYASSSLGEHIPHGRRGTVWI